MTSHSNLSPQKIATYNRQKCINLLEKITKNMFRMFRKEETTSEQITERFFHLKAQLDALWDIVLNADYHRDMKKYIETLAWTFSGNFNLDDLRWPQMSELNRLQKVKNQSGYKRKGRGR